MEEQNMKYIDLRSDTVTLPTQEMREAMYRAEVGDDVYGDDPTVNKLEEYAAALSGKDAALFVPSGTFGNQLALFTHCKRGNEVILGDDCHIVEHEVGAAAVIAGVQLRPLPSVRGELQPEAVEAKIRGVDLHFPETGLICLENAHSNGRVIPLDNMKKIYSIAQKHSIPVHLDGARLFNAALSLGVEATAVTTCCDSVMFCLSKGLCAPVGSILAGNARFIEKARKGRKLMGGGMRQAGILAAAGLVALEKMTGRLAEDHKNAILLGTELSKIPGVKVNLEDIQINMVFLDLSGTGFKPDLFMRGLLEKGIKANSPENGIMRLVPNYWTDSAAIMYTADAIRELVKQ